MGLVPIALGWYAVFLNVQLLHNVHFKCGEFWLEGDFAYDGCCCIFFTLNVRIGCLVVVRLIVCLRNGNDASRTHGNTHFLTLLREPPLELCALQIGWIHETDIFGDIQW